MIFLGGGGEGACGGGGQEMNTLGDEAFGDISVGSPLNRIISGVILESF